MPRRFLIGLLAFTTVAGFASGFASVSRRHCRHHADWGWDHSRYGSSARPAPGTSAAPAPDVREHITPEPQSAQQ